MLVKIVKYIVFCVYRRPCKLWPPVIFTSTREDRVGDVRPTFFLPCLGVVLKCVRHLCTHVVVAVVVTCRASRITTAAQTFVCLLSCYVSHMGPRGDDLQGR